MLYILARRFWSIFSNKYIVMIEDKKTFLQSKNCCKIFQKNIWKSLLKFKMRIFVTMPTSLIIHRASWHTLVQYNTTMSQYILGSIEMVLRRVWEYSYGEMAHFMLASGWEISALEKAYWFITMGMFIRENGSTTMLMAMVSFLG